MLKYMNTFTSVIVNTSENVFFIKTKNKMGLVRVKCT